MSKVDDFVNGLVEKNREIDQLRAYAELLEGSVMKVCPTIQAVLLRLPASGFENMKDDLREVLATLGVALSNPVTTGGPKAAEANTAPPYVCHETGQQWVARCLHCDYSFKTDAPIEERMRMAREHDCPNAPQLRHQSCTKSEGDMYVTVPVMPTDAMLEALYGPYLSPTSHASRRAAWAEALAAVPPLSGIVVPPIGAHPELTRAVNEFVAGKKSCGS